MNLHVPATYVCNYCVEHELHLDDFIEDGAYVTSNKVLHVRVPLLERGTCNSAYDSLTEDMLCAGVMAGGKDSCQVDDIV